MSNLFKLTFTPLFDGTNNINKYKVSVEYFDKNLISTVFDMRNSKKLGFVVYFRKHSIDVINNYLEGNNEESFVSKSALDDNCIIEQRCIQSYVDSIEHIKPQIEAFCSKKRREDELTKKAWDNWLQEKPIEYSF